MSGLRLLSTVLRNDLFKIVFTIVVLCCVQVVFRFMLGYIGWNHIARETIASLILCVLIFSFVGRRCLFLYLGVLFFVGLLYGVVGLTYGLPDGNAVEILMSTDGKETYEFLKRLPPHVYLYYVLFVALVLAASLSVYKVPDFKVDKRLGFLLVVVIFNDCIVECGEGICEGGMF